MTTITNDWAMHMWTIQVRDRTEYDVKCCVYLTLKEVPDDYHWPPHETQVADWNLEGWECLPALLKPEHEKEIEKQLLQLLEDEYGEH